MHHAHAPMRRVLLAALGAAALVPATAAAAPTAPSGYTLRQFAGAPAGVTNCDDIARLGRYIFVACQNGTQSTGGGGNSTVLQFDRRGSISKAFSLPDKIDGLGADPWRRRLIVTLNEDANSHLATISPWAPAARQITNYNYSPGAPDSPATTGALHTGGGTDSVIVGEDGTVYVSASHSSNPSGTATFRVRLTPPATPGGTGTATLKATFADNAIAANGNTGSGTVKLALNDVDSNAIVPSSSPFYAGQYVIDDQTSSQLVFSRDVNAGTGLIALTTTEGGMPQTLDDIRWVPGPFYDLRSRTGGLGTLYIVDKGAGGASVVYAVTGRFAPGTALASNDGLGTEVDTVNLAPGALAGTLTPFLTGLNTAKGLLFSPRRERDRGFGGGGFGGGEG